MQVFPIRDPSIRFFEKYGRVVVEFGRLEYVIKLCVKDLLGQGFTKGMAEAESMRRFRGLCDYAKGAASEQLTQDQAETFSDLVDQALELADYRNDSVHACWTTDESHQPLRIRPKWDKAAESVDWLPSEVSIAKLQNKAREIEGLRSALNAARSRWRLGTN